jgi:hypothetical protein
LLAAANLPSFEVSGRLSRDSEPPSRLACTALRSGGEEITGPCVLRGKKRARRSRARWGGVGMYPFLYWTGMGTLLVWTAVSAYTAFIGF